MANQITYTLHYTNGLFLVTIPEQAVNSTGTSLVLYGRGAVEYGQGIQQNLISLLENFAHNTAPFKPIQGQFWYDTAFGLPKFFNGTDWIAIVGTESTDLASLSEGQIPIIGADDKLHYKDVTGPVHITSDGETSIETTINISLTGAVSGNVDMDGLENIEISTTLEPSAIDGLKGGHIKGVLDTTSSGGKYMIDLSVPFKMNLMHLKFLGTSSASIVLNHTNVLSDGDNITLSTDTPIAATTLSPNIVRDVDLTGSPYLLFPGQSLNISVISVIPTGGNVQYSLEYERA